MKIIIKLLNTNQLYDAQTKIGGPFETAKRNLLKDVKGFEKVVYRDGDVQIIVAFGFAQVGGDEAVQNIILRINLRIIADIS